MCEVLKGDEALRLELAFESRRRKGQADAMRLMATDDHVRIWMVKLACSLITEVGCRASAKSPGSTQATKGSPTQLQKLLATGSPLHFREHLEQLILCEARDEHRILAGREGLPVIHADDVIETW